MRIVTFASGSTGNCGLISCGKTNILLDAGISMRRIVNGLAACGLTPQNVCGVLITHEHSDHISGLSMLEKHYNLDIFAPVELASAIEKLKPELKNKIKYINTGEYFNVGQMRVKPFRTPHDSSYSVGYRFEGDGIIAFATDTGCVTDDMIKGLEGADIALIEANHNIEMLKNGPYPYYLVQRIMADTGHLSNYECGKLALHLAKTGTKHIILGHLSRDNNTPECAKREVAAFLEQTEVTLSVAPACEMFTVSCGENEKCLV